MVAEIGEFKKNPVIKLTKDEKAKYPFTFGLTKAKLILDHIEDIKKFVADNDKDKGREKAINNP